MFNQAVRAAAKAHGVKLWEVAERIQVSDGNLSRKLRRELPKDVQECLLAIIAEIAEEKNAKENDKK